MVTVSVKGWVLLSKAAEELKVHPETIRRLVRSGDFTRGQFTTGKKKAPIYIKLTELAAYKRGGLEAVAASRQVSERRAASAAN